jgi:hypothetical protein
MKRRYIATAPDGTQFTRGTTRTYTHAVICWCTDVEPKRWGLVSFAGSAVLATKAADRWNRHVPERLARVVPAVEAA